MRKREALCESVFKSVGLTPALPQIVKDFESTPSTKISAKREVLRTAEVRTQSAHRTAEAAALMAARIRGQLQRPVEGQSSCSSNDGTQTIGKPGYFPVTSFGKRRPPSAGRPPSARTRPPSAGGSEKRTARESSPRASRARPLENFSIIENFSIHSDFSYPSAHRKSNGLPSMRTTSAPLQISESDSLSDSKVEAADVCHFFCLPQALIMRISVWLNPRDLALLAMTHRSLNENSDDIASWIAQVVLGRSVMQARSHRRLASVPPLQLLQFLSKQNEIQQQTRGQQLGAGLRHSLVLLNGVIHAFGATACGQLGLGPGMQVVEVPRTLSMPEAVEMVACGGDHSLVITKSGSVWAFGRNADGQLGTAEDAEAVFFPERVSSLPSRAIHAACGVDHSLILTEEGHVWGCGRAEEGQLGIKLSANEADKVPQRIEALHDVVLVSCGADHSMALDAFGRVWGFGENCKGQLGLGHCDREYQPVEVSLPRGALAVQVACGGAHTLVINEAGQVYGFGGNEQRQLGFEDLDDFLSPTSLHKLVPCISFISCGLGHSVLLTTSGAVWTLGGKLAKEDGPGPPQRIRGGLQGMRTTCVAAGGQHTLCKVQNSFFSFGGGSDAQLGWGVVSEPCNQPRHIALRHSDYAAQFSCT